MTITRRDSSLAWGLNVRIATWNINSVTTRTRFALESTA